MDNVIDWVTERHLSFSTRPRLESLADLCNIAIERTSEGSIAEFGMALGGTGIVLAETAKGRRDFHGFDVFEMIPEPSDRDDEKSRNIYKVIVSGKRKGHAPNEEYYGYRKNLLGEITGRLAERGMVVDGRTVSLHKGLIQDTWPPMEMPVAFAHVDCDWYDPVKCCLDHLRTRVVVGGIIVIDDYQAFHGATVAANEFMAGTKGVFAWLDRSRKAIERVA